MEVDEPCLGTWLGRQALASAPASERCKKQQIKENEMRARGITNEVDRQSRQRMAIKSRCGSSVLPTRCTSHAGFKTTACGEALTGAAGGREAAPRREVLPRGGRQKAKRNAVGRGKCRRRWEVEAAAGEVEEPGQVPERRIPV